MFNMFTMLFLLVGEHGWSGDVSRATVSPSLPGTQGRRRTSDLRWLWWCINSVSSCWIQQWQGRVEGSPTVCGRCQTTNTRHCHWTCKYFSFSYLLLFTLFVFL